MKNSKYILIALLVVALVLSIVISKFSLAESLPDGEGDYNSSWEKVEKFEKDGLPKSALKIVDEIYEKAKQESDYDQLVKSIIYKFKINNSISDDGFEATIKMGEDELKTAVFPVKNILHSILADMYWMYYRNNRWKFYNRSVTTGFDNDDYTTWSLDQLADRVIKYNLNALENADELKKIPLNQFSEIIDKGNLPPSLRPTMYDFIAHRALDFFYSSEIALTRPQEKFELDNTKYFLPAEVFVEQKINSSDSLSLQYHAIRILKELIAFRLTEKNPEALIDVDLARYKFLNNVSVVPEKDKLYLDALLSMQKKYADIPFKTEIDYELAGYYKKQSAKYNPSDSTSYSYKDYNKTAVDICKQAIAQYPKTSGTQKCKSLLNELESVELSSACEEYIPNNERFPIQINYQNLNTIYFKLARINRTDYNELKKKYYGYEFYDKLAKNAELKYTDTIILPGEPDYNNHITEYLVKPQELGEYIFVISNNLDFSYKENIVAYKLVTITNLSYLQRGMDNGNFDIYVLNRKNGKPEKDVTIQTYYQKYDYDTREYKQYKGPKVISNEKGFANIPYSEELKSRSYTLELAKGEDYLNTGTAIYSYNRKTKKRTYVRSYFFTDRAIYRPGQTVYFKGIILETDGENSEILQNHKATITFYDHNAQKVSDLELTSNEYGTVSGSFQIPQGMVTGRYRISDENSNHYISVEEYKRPAFEVEMLPFDGNYRLNDTVEVKGKAVAYAGSNITDARVSYRIVREANWRGWWRPYYFSYSSTEIQHGETKTDDTGKFSLSFVAKPDKSYEKSPELSFTYTIYADITDLNGETRSTSGYLEVGYVGLDLSINTPSYINIHDKQEYTLSSYNLNGEFISADVNWEVIKLKEPESVLRNRKLSNPDVRLYTPGEWKKLFPGNVYDNENDVRNLQEIDKVLAGTYKTQKDKKISIPELSKLEPARYKIVLKSRDIFGNEVKRERIFTIINPDEKNMPARIETIFVKSKQSAEPGDSVCFIVGSALENASFLYEIESQGEIVYSEQFVLQDEQRKIVIPVKEDYRGNFAVYFTMVNNNREYFYSDIIYVPYTNKQLDIEFETFRDKLYPGQKEEWKLRIKSKNGEKLAAEMMATLYDASLDYFKPNYWYLSLYKNYYASKSWQSYTFKTGNATILQKDFREYVPMPSEYYDKLNWFGFSYYGNYYYREGNRSKARFYSGVMSTEAAAPPSADDPGVPMEEVEEEALMEGDFKDAESTNTVAVSADKSDGDGRAEAERIDEVGNTSPSGEVQVRTNFNETAFFYPQLKTDDDGVVTISFTIPESLTKWKMLGLAHTKDLKIGYTSNELITQKDLMVMPNPPRFFRENDKMVFPVKISNVSDNNLDGEVSIEFFNALTEEKLDIVKGKPLSQFKVKSGQNILVDFAIEIPEGTGAIGYKVIAKAGKHSDGEKKVLPVLTNRMLVTESMPLPIKGKQTKSFSFTKLLQSASSSTLRHQNLTLEMTSNPAWYAVQALPYLMEYPYECYEQTFSRFYANSLASHIANSSPKIKAVFDQWRNNPDSKALLSNLDKNKELKALLLEETPWVLNSQDESERKRRIALLFDLNKMSSELNKAMKKLVDGQVSNGGWPWFDGMEESRYITQHIVCGMGHLDRLNVTNVKTDPKVRLMIEKAVSYLDSRIIEDYNKLRKYVKKADLEKKHISYTQIHYLYARSFFTDIPLPRKLNEAFEYYKGQAERYWLTESKYMQGLIALSIYRWGNKPVAEKIVASLREYAIHDEEMGMYWKSPGGYYWYQAPIERQAVLIELFTEVAQDQSAVDEMKVWLLKQKQTQDWKTTKATVEAVYALLLQGSAWLDNDDLVSVKLGDIVVDPNKDKSIQNEAGTGYYKVSWDASEIVPEMGNIEVTKNSEGVSWGAVYWQYFEQLDKITPHETPLQLKKQLFVERKTDRGKVIEPINKSELNVGDRVMVRIELRVDRAMEYVHLKDMRASGFEPENVFSRYKYQDGLGYYESTRDAATNFFISWLPKGTFVFEYPLRVSHKGDFSNGITTIQCMYAPEFSSHSEGVRVEVK